MKSETKKIVEDGIEYTVIETPLFRTWRLNDKLHRIKGPALEDLLFENEEDTIQEWHLNGEKINCKSQEEFERILKLKAFL